MAGMMQISNCVVLTIPCIIYIVTTTLCQLQHAVVSFIFTLAVWLMPALSLYH